MHRIARRGFVSSTRGRAFTSTTNHPCRNGSSPLVVYRASEGANQINNMAYQMRNASLHSINRHFSSETTNDAKTEVENGGSAESTDPTVATGESVEGEAVENDDKAEIDRLQEEIKNLKDKVLREMAEQENVRRIAKKDVENARQYGITSFAKALLDVSDNFERALEAIPMDKRAELEAGNGDPIFKSLLEGIEAVEKGMHKTFSTFGLVSYGKVGDTFDPELHDALFEITDSHKEEGSLGQVVKTGYKLKDRVIRAAQVGTIRKP